MRLEEILNEAPFTDKQEQRFLAALRADREEEWPDQVKMSRLVKNVSPAAKRVGQGMYSQAFGRANSSKVIKLTTGGDGENTLNFLRWAKRRQRNPHLPKIFAIEKFGKDTYNTNVYARMERLVPLHPKKYNWKPDHVRFLNWMYEHDYSDSPRGIVGREKWRQLQRKPAKSDTSIHLIKLIQDLEDAFDVLDLYISRSGTAHNIMIRPGTNELVIHDPVA